MMRIVLLWSLVGGVICALAQGNLHVSELSLLTLLTSKLVRGDILLGESEIGSQQPSSEE